MLTAATKEPSVKRVVVTSSVGVLELKEGNDRAGREKDPDSFSE